MRNAVSLLKHYPLGTDLSRTALLLLIVATGLASHGSGAAAQGSSPAAPASHSPLVGRQSPLANRQSPLATRHSPLADRQPSLATRHSPLADRQPSLATRHSPLATRQSSLASLPLPGKPDPALAAILLPRHAPPGAYRLAVIDQPIEAARAAVMAALAPAARVDDPSGAWAIRPSDPLEAFGEGGIYRRSRLARLFAGKPAYLVRGPVERDGQVVASVTLIAPCPDAQLSRLSQATIAILFDVAAAKGR